VAVVAVCISGNGTARWATVLGRRLRRAQMLAVVAARGGEATGRRGEGQLWLPDAGILQLPYDTTINLPFLYAEAIAGLTQLSHGSSQDRTLAERSLGRIPSLERRCAAGRARAVGRRARAAPCVCATRKRGFRPAGPTGEPPGGRRGTTAGLGLGQDRARAAPAGPPRPRRRSSRCDKTQDQLQLVHPLLPQERPIATASLQKSMRLT
jgi:hypothetical protein